MLSEIPLLNINSLRAGHISISILFKREERRKERGKTEGKGDGRRDEKER